MDEAGKRRRNTLRQCRSAVISSSLMQSFCALRRPRSRSRDAVSAEGASEAELGPPAQAAAGQTKSQGKRSKFMDFARSFLLDEVELGFKKYPY